MHLLRNERPPKSYVRVIFMKYRLEQRSAPYPSQKVTISLHSWLHCGGHFLESSKNHRKYLGRLISLKVKHKYFLFFVHLPPLPICSVYQNGCFISNGTSSIIEETKKNFSVAYLSVFTLRFVF